MFKEITPEHLAINPFVDIKDKWFLVGTGNKENCNAMTASWGMLGYAFRKNTVTIMVRPQRHTYTMLESSDYFSISFLPNEYRHILNFCGKFSGKKCDKIKNTSLTPIQYNKDVCYFNEAEAVLICKKFFNQMLDEKSFLCNEILQHHYKEKDFHKLYIGEIEKILVK